ncbi:MAG: AAA family ATPase [Lachnospiraceae bacterium]|nr:AAA family ATPase [Lachnospiraceae bacterium]
MGKIIAVANNKGGVGKTSTAINLGAALAEKGKTILMVDSDPQGNATSGLGLDKNNLDYTLYDLLLGEANAQDCIIKDVAENMSLIPANMDLSGFEIDLLDSVDDRRQYLLKDEIDYVKDQYDYIIIDCPPAVNQMTINVLTASDAVIVPIQCEYFALEGLTQLIETITKIKERLNEKLTIDGVVFTMYDSRTNLSNQVVQDVRDNLPGEMIYNTIIPRSVRLAEAPSYGQSILVYDPKSTGAEAYRALAEEVMHKK